MRRSHWIAANLLSICVVIAVSWWSRPELAPVQTSSQEPSAAREMQIRLTRLERQLTELALASKAREAAMKPEPSTQPSSASDSEVPPARAPKLTPDEDMRAQVQRLEERIKTEAPDRGATHEVEQRLSETLQRLGLVRASLTDVSCYESLCRAALRFADTAYRDDDFMALVDTIQEGFYAYVPSGESRTGELYLARKGHRIFSNPETPM